MATIPSIINTFSLISPFNFLLIQVWNDELASLAQNYAGQCIFDHNQLRSNQQSSFSYVGENLAISSSPRANYTRQIQGWNDEVVFYDYSANQCSDVCGHYTQVCVLALYTSFTITYMAC